MTRGSRRPRAALAVILLTFTGLSAARAQRAAPTPTATGALVAAYIERYFDLYPTRATEAGRHDRDGLIEDFSR